MNPAVIPNAITVGRLALVPPLGWLLLESRFVEALALFAVAGVSDGLDGLLARRFGWTSRLGAILDPAADKLLMLVCFGALTRLGLLPLWLFVVMLVRDLGIVGGSLFLRGYVGPAFRPVPGWSGKGHTFVQVVLVLAVILAALEVGRVSAVIPVLVGLAALTAGVSAAEYFVRAWRELAKARQTTKREGSR